MDIMFNIISTGSKGNAVVIEDRILIDCGVPYYKLNGAIDTLQIVLLTHIHSDHFNPSTIRRLAYNRPSLRFGCGKWLVRPLIEAGVNPDNIDILIADQWYGYNGFKVQPISLVHNVPNQGYKLVLSQGRKLIYATDTNNLNGIEAKNYDLYLIEANYVDEEIQERIKEKEEQGIYPYEYEVLKNHLSKAKCDDFIVRNSGPQSSFVYMHCHED